MASKRESHLFFARKPAPAPERPQGDTARRGGRLDRGERPKTIRRGIDFGAFQELTAQASEQVQTSATIGRITGRVPTDLRKIQQRMEYHEAHGTLRPYVLEHADEVIALLCGNTKRALSIVMSALDEPRVAYLQTLKNLLLADLKPSAHGGPYLDLYLAITDLMGASYNYLAACGPQSTATLSTQTDLCMQVRARAEQFYRLLATILVGQEASAGLPAAPPGVITEASMELRRAARPRLGR